jgi:anti-sigma regulatory factor (Ser/Thr protein kinase)
MAAHSPQMRSLSLAAEPRSPMRARRFVIDILTEHDALQVASDATLLVSELVTNAVVHVGTPSVVTVAVDGAAVMITVADRGNGPLLVRPPSDFAESGRGLWLVHEMASAWGTNHDAAGTSVWFRLDREATLAAGSVEPPIVEFAAQPAEPAAVGSDEAWSAVEWLLSTDPDLASTAALSEQVARAVDVLRADVAALLAPGAFDGEDVLVLGLPTAAAEALQIRRSEAQVEQVLRAHGITQFLHAPLPDGTGALHVGWCDGQPADTAPVLGALAAGRLALLLRVQRLEETDSRRHGFAAMLAEASDLLGGSLDPELTAALVPSLVVPRLARWAAVHLAADDGRLVLAAVGHVDEDKIPSLREKLSAPAVDGTEVSALTGLGQVVVLPLTARRRQLGQLTLGLDPSSALRQDAYAVAEDLARRAALALDNARVHREQREVAQALQDALLPPQLPTDQAIEFGAQYVAAGEGAVVGGDFYDVIPLADGAYGLIVGDVQGKGPIAASVTGASREIVRVLLGLGRPLDEILRQLNSMLLKHEPSRFCTAVLGRMTAGQLSLCIAGHPSPVFVRPDDEPRLIGAPGPLLGVMEELEVEEVTMALQPGDALVLYTDGLTERRDEPAEESRSKLLRRLAELGSGPLDPFLDTFLDSGVVAADDDIAIMAIRRLPV